MIQKALSNSSVMSMPAADVPSAAASVRSRAVAAAKAARSQAAACEHAEQQPSAGLAPAARYLQRYRLWAESSLKSVRLCGRAPVGGGVGILRYPSGNIEASGTQSCHSVWACPVCSDKILRSRAKELASDLDMAQRMGHEISFVTFTVRHHSQEPLRVVLKRLNRLWRKTVNGSAMRRFSADIEPLKWVRVLEVTYGENGWHPHYHVVIVGHHAQFAAEQLRSEWLDKGGKWTSPKHAVLIRGKCDSRVAAYLAKVTRAASSLALELHGGRRKDAYLLSVKGLFEADGSYALYREYEQATRGKRQMFRNKNWRLLFGEDQSDEQALAAGYSESCDTFGPVYGPPEMLGILPASAYKALADTNAYPDFLRDVSAARQNFSAWFGDGFVDDLASHSYRFMRC